MSQVLVVPYKSGSESAKLLANSLNCKRMKLEGSSVTDKNDLVLINWGNSTIDLSSFRQARVFNKPHKIRLASHKLEFFKTIDRDNADSILPIPIPDWTTHVSIARQWYDEGHDVVIRNVMQGHSGEGLDLIRYKEDVSASSAVYNAPLYTKYMKKRDEYRVHVVKNVPILIQRKAVPHGTTPENYQIRNHSNGFVFTISDVKPSPSVISSAVNAVNVLGLDFGAVDVIWNERKKEATVLEVNTACGLNGNTTLARYSGALQALIDNKKIPRYDEVLTSDQLALQSLTELDEALNVPYDVDDYYIEEGETVYLTDNLYTCLRRFMNNGGKSDALERWMEDDYHGRSGYFFVYEVVGDDGELVLCYNDSEEEQWCLPITIAPCHVYT